MSRFAHLIAITALFLVAGFSTGCATIFGGTHKDVAITSNPPGANVLIYNSATDQEVDHGVTPFNIRLKRGRTYFVPANYDVKCEYGGEQKSFHVRSGASIWYFGNLLFGGLIGMVIVDPLTGAMWDPPGKVHFDFNNASTTSATNPTTSYTSTPTPYALPAPPLYAPNPASLPSIYKPLPAGAQ